MSTRIAPETNGTAAVGSDAARGEIDAVRARIEQIDLQLISLIAERVRHGRALGQAKRALRLPVLDPAREATVVRRAGELARTAGLADDDVREIFWHLIGLSRRAQQEDQ